MRFESDRIERDKAVDELLDLARVAKESHIGAAIRHDRQVLHARAKDLAHDGHRLAPGAPASDTDRHSVSEFGDCLFLRSPLIHEWHFLLIRWSSRGGLIGAAATAIARAQKRWAFEIMRAYVPESGSGPRSCGRSGFEKKNRFVVESRGLKSARGGSGSTAQDELRPGPAGHTITRRSVSFDP